MWDERYNSDDFFYGTEPNDFLKSVIKFLPPAGKVLSLAEGEGRNAVFLAKNGFDVVGVDSSSVGLKKAQQLADKSGVTIKTVCADLADFTIEKSTYDVVNIIFCHLPRPLRDNVFKAAVAGLKPGGAIVMEVYSTEQLTYNTGGPSDAGWLSTFEELDDYFGELKMVIKQKILRTIYEGERHYGLSSVIQVLAFKPE